MKLKARRLSKTEQLFELMKRRIHVRYCKQKKRQIQAAKNIISFECTQLVWQLQHRCEPSTMTSMLVNYTFDNRLETIAFAPRFGYMNIQVEEFKLRLAFRLTQECTSCSLRKRVRVLEWSFALEQPDYNTIVLAGQDLWPYTTNAVTKIEYEQSVYQQRLSGCAHAWNNDTILMSRNDGLTITGNTNIVRVTIDMEADLESTLQTYLCKLRAAASKWIVCRSCSKLERKQPCSWEYNQKEGLVALLIVDASKECHRCRFKNTQSCQALVLFEGPVLRYQFETLPFYAKVNFEKVGWN